MTIVQKWDSENGDFFEVDETAELATVVERQKADILRLALEGCIAMGIRINGPEDIAKLKAKLAPIYERIDQSAAEAEKVMRDHDGISSQ